MPTHPDQAAADWFGLIRDPTRLAFLRALAGSRQTLDDLAPLAATGYPGATSHLRKLRRAGVVVARRSRSVSSSTLAGGAVVTADEVTFTRASGVKAVDPRV